MASISKKDMLLRIFDLVVPFVDSLGMNEQVRYYTTNIYLQIFFNIIGPLQNIFISDRRYMRCYKKNERKYIYCKMNIGKTKTIGNIFKTIQFVSTKR